MRTTRIFTWETNTGERWSDVLRKNTRKEFEQSRYESDPETIAKLLVMGRDCLNEVRARYIDTAQKIKDDIDSTRTS